MPRTFLTPDDQKRIALYFELLQRYHNLPAPQMLPLVAIRVLCIRRGYERVMGAIQRWGEDIVVGYARDELKEMARLWAFMVHQDPPPQDKREGLMNSIKMTRDGASDPAVTKRMYEILGRCGLRETWLRQRLRTIQRKGQH